MMAAAQPFLSGSIGHTLTLPQGATVAEARAALLLAWRLGLKAIAVEREDAGVAAPLADLLPAILSTVPGGFGRPAAIGEGQADTATARRAEAPAERPSRVASGDTRYSQALAIARAVRSFGDMLPTTRPDHDQRTDQTHGTAIGKGAEQPTDARSSRRRSSHAARSAASVPSSADAAVEQRQV